MMPKQRGRSEYTCKRVILDQAKWVFLLLLFLSAHFPAHAAMKPQPEIILDPPAPGPGDIVVLTLKNIPAPPEGTFDGRKLYWYSANGATTAFKAILGIDLYTKPGGYNLDITAENAVIHRTVVISKKKYPVQRLKLPKGMVELSPENEARVEREQKKMAAVWPNVSPRGWSGNFINPCEGEIVTKFGVQRIINKIPKSSHTGVDVSAKEGDAVRAPNNGVAVLIDDQFFSGNSIVLDHGQGIYTMFFHLSRILIRPGQTVAKGEVIGLVGSTGRSTGAHLHWGVRVQGARVNPMELIQLKLE